MSLAEAANVFEPSKRLMPRWTRAAGLGLVLAAHAVVFLKLSTAIPITPLPSIAIEFSPLPDALQPPLAEPLAAAAEPEAATALPQEPQEKPVPEVETIAPVPEPVVEPIAEPVPAPKIEPPKPEPKPEPKPLPRPVPKPDPKPGSKVLAKPERPLAQKPAPIAPVASPRAAPPQQASASPAQRAAPAAPGISAASYAALVAGELNRHKAYPESARAAGASGSVGVAFTIGPSGRATSISLTSPSGNAALDSAARQAVASIHAPPPPGGIFRTSTTIRFSLR